MPQDVKVLTQYNRILSINNGPSDTCRLQLTMAVIRRADLQSQCTCNLHH